MPDLKKIICWPQSPHILSLGLCTCLVLEWFTTLLQVHNQSKVNLAATQPVFSSTQKSHATQAYSPILFGNYEPKQTVKQSMLNLVIVGILLANQEVASKVILRTPSGREVSFKQGDTVPGGARILKITAESVLLDYQGSLERLELPKLKGVE